jgi:hypothetical protein
MKKLFLVLGCLVGLASQAQKKPLDHTVYDGWQSLSDRSLSKDGRWLIYSVNPQEGDGVLTVQSVSGNYKKEIPRGYSAVISDDSRYLVFRIKPFFKDTRDAKIKKRKPDDMPKDSLGILQLGADNLVKISRIKSFKLPDESGTWVAYLLEKPAADANRARGEQDSSARINAMLAMADSLAHIADSIRNKVNDVKTRGLSVLRPRRDAPPAAGRNDDPFDEGTDLVLRNLQTGQEFTIKLVSEYFFNKKSNVLLFETTRKTGDNSVKATVARMDLATNAITTIFKSFNDAKGYRMD